MSDRLATAYREFAHNSPLYAELGAGVAEDRELLAWLAGLPQGKRQPNLVFAAYRLVAGTPSGWEEFETTLKDRRDEVEAVMLARRTQTNEAARCALMLPLLAALPQPLALLEVGASAGPVPAAGPLRLRLRHPLAGHRPTGAAVPGRG